MHAAPAPLEPIPPPILASAFLAAGGVAVYAGFPDAPTVAALDVESRQQLAEASRQESAEPDSVEGRGGRPPRRLSTSGGGPAQDAFYRDPGVSAFLSQTCGLTVAPSGNRGSYSYYAHPGDFLGLHRDVHTCDLAVLTALHDASHSADRSGSLVVYPQRMFEPLSSIRASPWNGAHSLKLEPGQTALLLGGIVPHQVLPVREGQVRVISVLCFRVLV